MAAPNINWDTITEEATDILSRYIAIDTTNPPGNAALRPYFNAHNPSNAGFWLGTVNMGWLNKAPA
jgi:hypothetical protein